MRKNCEKCIEKKKENVRIISTSLVWKLRRWMSIWSASFHIYIATATITVSVCRFILNKILTERAK